MIHEIKKLINEEGMILLHYVPYDAEAGISDKFQGVVHMQTPAGLIPIEFDFPPVVKSPEEAYAIFKETAQAYVKSMEDEAPRIITPGDL